MCLGLIFPSPPGFSPPPLNGNYSYFLRTAYITSFQNIPTLKSCAYTPLNKLSIRSLVYSIQINIKQYAPCIIVQQTLSIRPQDHLHCAPIVIMYSSEMCGCHIQFSICAYQMWNVWCFLRISFIRLFICSILYLRQIYTSSNLIFWVSVFLQRETTRSCSSYLRYFPNTLNPARWNYYSIHVAVEH